MNKIIGIHIDNNHDSYNERNYYKIRKSIDYELKIYT